MIFFVSLGEFLKILSVTIKSLVSKQMRIEAWLRYQTRERQVIRDCVEEDMIISPTLVEKKYDEKGA